MGPVVPSLPISTQPISTQLPTIFSRTALVQVSADIKAAVDVPVDA